MLVKKNFQDFYSEIRSEFPRTKELETWDKYDCSVHGYEHSSIMTELSRELENWVVEGGNSEVQRVMDTIEKYFHEGDVPVTSIIYSDFLVTIMEMKTVTREIIKGMLGPETRKHYFNLLNLYRELDE
jgi:hypothetical protein